MRFTETRREELLQRAFNAFQVLDERLDALYNCHGLDTRDFERLEHCMAQVRKRYAEILPWDARGNHLPLAAWQDDGPLLGD